MGTDTSRRSRRARGVAARTPAPAVEHGRWLLLLLQLPASPSRARVKVWRRLQQLGAIAIRNAVYVLPDSPQAREDFEWMKAEILADKGEASVFAADTIDSLTDDEIVAAFRAERERSFGTIREDARRLKQQCTQAGAVRGTALRRVQRAVRLLRDRFAEVAANDLFGARGRQETESAIAELERQVAWPVSTPGQRPKPGELLSTRDYQGRTWITRPRPGIDRSGTAWLIRRFIDPAARFAFGDPPRSSSKLVPFDMYEVEFSHHGDRCTFEVLVQRFGIDDAAVARLGRLVHDVDLKQTRYNVPEAATVARLIDGFRQLHAQDGDLLEHGIALFEALYRSYRSDMDLASQSQPSRRTRQPESPRKKGS